MHKIWTLFKREYRAAVRTKSFIIGLVLVPVMMAGGLVVTILTQNNVDIDARHFVIIDHSGLLEEDLSRAAELRNSEEIIHERTGELTAPPYYLEFEQADENDPAAQSLRLSDRVRSKELHAYIEIGPEVLHPYGQQEKAYLRYYSEHSFNDQYRYWFRDVINNNLRNKRAAELALDEAQSSNLNWWFGIEGMSLAEVDEKTGEQTAASQSSDMAGFFVPYALVLLMFMLVMTSATPQLSNVMEEKNEKVAEVLMGSVTPFQFMMGKVLGSVAVTMTTTLIYLTAAVGTMVYTGTENFIPYDALPWFLVYTLLFVLMVGAGMTALGATCNDNKDAQSLSFPAIMPLIIPMFFITAVIQDPTGSLATTLSLIPPFTPTMMIMRLGSSVSIPLWQPIVGLVGVALFALFTIWIGARVFRTAILITGQKPTMANLVKYAFRS